MKICLLLFLIGLCYLSVRSQNFIKPTFLDNFLKEYRFARNVLSKLIGKNSEDPENLAIAKSLNLLQKQVPKSLKFPCNVTGFRSFKPPNTVNEVKPGDIDIIAAIGDSLTAGNGIVSTNLLQIVVENRGLSWSIGGQGTWRESLTLPNILKEFNPNLFGYSLGDSLTTDIESQFNVAETGSVSGELPFMTRQLIRRIKSDSRVDLQNHWKLITIMIGLNNFCLDLCFQPNPEDLTYHKNDLLQTLRLLRDNLPRTIVNLVPPPDGSKVPQLKPKPDYCEVLNRVIYCYCFLQPIYQNQTARFGRIVQQWRKLDEQIAKMPEFNTEDFAVVYQPFTLNFKIPRDSDHKLDLSYLAYDCYHMSQKLNAEAANALWNNMLEIPGQKSTTNSRLFSKFLCPTEENPFIYTNNMFPEFLYF